MADHPDLEQLYTDAKSALKAREYDRARDLLTNILAVDENYRDTSRLLAQTVRLRRQRWYNHPTLWMVIGLAVVIGLGIVIVPKLHGSPSRQIPSPTHQPTVAQPLQSTAVSSPTPAPTSIPLNWSRLNLTQFLPRATIHAIAINPSDPDMIYVGTLDAGVFKSIDGGISWQPAQNGMGGASIDTLVIDPQEPDTLYAGVYQDGLYKTIDGGANWVSLGPEFTATWGVDSIIVIDLSDHQHLYYGTGAVGFESHDGGKNWSRFYLTCSQVIGALLLDPEDQSLYTTPSGIYNACISGVYQSSDHGRTWTLVGLKGVDNIEGLYMATDLHGNKLLIANTTGLASRTEKSGGSNKSWAKNTTVILSNTDQHLFFSIDHGKSWNTQAIGCNTVAVDPQTPTTLYCGKTNGGIIKSIDGGLSWKEILGVNSGIFQAVSVLGGVSPRLVAGGINVAISADQGASWTNYDSGLAGQWVDLTLDPSNASILYLENNADWGNCHPLYRSIDAGRTWNLVSSTGCGLSFGPGGTDLYRADMDPNSSAGLLFHSTDQGADWTPLAMPHGCERVYANPLVPGALIAACPSSDSNTFFYSDDFGKTWQMSSIGDNDQNNARLYFSGSNGQRVYDITDYDFLSDDGGKSWIRCLGLGEPDTSSLSSESRLIIDPQNPEHILLATTGSGVLTSTDGCRSWRESNTGLGSLLVNTLARDPKNVNIIYAGMDGGAYVSFNSGQSWGQINDGLLGATVVYSIVVDPQSNVYAATPYGIFKLEKK